VKFDAETYNNNYLCINIVKSSLLSSAMAEKLEVNFQLSRNNQQDATL